MWVLECTDLMGKSFGIPSHKLRNNILAIGSAATATISLGFRNSALGFRVLGCPEKAKI